MKQKEVTVVVTAGRIMGVSVLSLVALCASTASAVPASDPLLGVGHGVFFGPDGEEIKPTSDLVRDAQAYYLARLRREASPATLARLRTLEAKLKAKEKTLGLDPTISDALLLTWLVKDVNPTDRGGLATKIAALIKYYGSQHGGPAPKDRRGLSGPIAAFAEQEGLIPSLSTMNGGAAYRSECRTKEVPIPPDWGDPAWIFNGDLTNEFILGSKDAKVYTYVSTQPAGICYALPRISGNTIDNLGVICLGTDSGNACFWDQASVGVDEDVPFADFVGGADLEFWPGGTCSDCHAGENPFVIHPGTALDTGANIQSPRWHTPLVPTSWPINPGPTSVLDLLPFPPGDSCATCHVAAAGGRFPEVSSLPLYCRDVLKPAIAETMPPSDPGKQKKGSGFATHAEVLTYLCTQDPPGGQDVPGNDYPDDTDFLSPPIIVEPLYGCAEMIEVRGGVRHAELLVFVDDVLATIQEVLEPDAQAVKVPPLVAGQKVTAVQRLGMLESGISNVAEVRDHTVDFPEGLPAPVIDPNLIYECGRTISVRHVRGAKLTVYSNGNNPRTISTPGDWTDIRPRKQPFDKGDRFTAEIQMCTETSPLSEAEMALDAPANIPAPKFEPEEPWAGQELVNVFDLLHGALTTVAINGFGTVAEFSTGITYKENVDIESGYGQPVQNGDSLEVIQDLCKVGDPTRSDPARPCESIPAPRIKDPYVGQSQVIVTSAIPGARIFVYEEGGEELGDGSGSVIALGRSLVAGDVLVVRQRIGSCTSNSAYQVKVGCYLPNQGCD